MTSETRLLATCWTTAGSASPAGPIYRSPFTLEERIAATAAGGWTGFGLVHADLMEFQRARPLEDIRRLLDDHGIEQLELELIEDWWADDDRRSASDAVRHDIFAAAEVLGAATVKVGPDTAAPADPERFAESFDALATEAAEHGTRVALEFLPFAHTMHDLEAGIELVTGVDNPAGGLCLDIWHVARPGTDYSVIAESLPGRYLFAVELNDASTRPVGSLFEDTVHRRLLPGQGSFDVPGFINAVRRTGYRGMWGVEMLSDRHRTLELPRALEEARSAALACFTEADRRLV
ncbi:sugar phosphate isomerase/epimerase family protein [Leucobacter tenebrionis]|uniref:sugar phosphate isomerase/epimerase family protein n=1 Tax=Leucobacter tenebrionis TaxID=2873270 RepID=UPI001CA7394A|nr:sugar phosphate isomerase/epimerase family protein [Leucobacter tenebrionis]QZY50774.1 sugar phosphate isomerase/epimerase [Leucobacter tenebrionis]